MNPFKIGDYVKCIAKVNPQYEHHNRHTKRVLARTPGEFYGWVDKKEKL